MDSGCFFLLNPCCHHPSPLICPLISVLLKPTQRVASVFCTAKKKPCGKADLTHLLLFYHCLDSIYIYEAINVIKWLVSPKHNAMNYFTLPSVSTQLIFCIYLHLVYWPLWVKLKKCHSKQGFVTFNVTDIQACDRVVVHIQYFKAHNFFVIMLQPYMYFVSCSDFIVSTTEAQHLKVVVKWKL